MTYFERSLSLVLVAFVWCLGFSLACGGQAIDEPLPVVRVAEVEAVHTVEDVVEEANLWPAYDLWSDCKSFCDRASVHCAIAEAESGMACFMQCDIAAQWEGMEQPNDFSAAIREELICTVRATDCDQVRACLTND